MPIQRTEEQSAWDRINDTLLNNPFIYPTDAAGNRLTPDQRKQAEKSGLLTGWRGGSGPYCFGLDGLLCQALPKVSQPTCRVVANGLCLLVGLAVIFALLYLGLGSLFR